jgi:glycosyltransferase involved in cell wall biosynthesis
MKIGIYVQTWHVGGVAAFSERLAQGLHDAGHATSVILSTPFGKRDQAGRAAYETLTRAYPGLVTCLHLNAFHPKERAWRAADTIAALGLDVLLLSAHGPMAEAWARLCHGTPLIGVAHNDDDDTYGEFKACEPYCDAYVTVSAAISQTLGLLARKTPPVLLRHIPSGVPISATPRRASETSQPGVLTVCRLDQTQKRVRDLPLIWNEYRRLGGSATFTLCGSGPEESHLRQAFAAELARGTVRLLGAVPLAQMPGLYANHDLLLSVSGYEGLPLAVLEAATHGLWPLLSETRSGHPEIVESLGAGRLCAVGDVGAFAAALREATAEIEQIRRLRPMIQAAARARFGLERMVRDYADLAAEVLKRRAAQGSPSACRNAAQARPKADFLRRFIRKWQYSRHYGWRDYC